MPLSEEMLRAIAGGDTDKIDELRNELHDATNFNEALSLLSSLSSSQNITAVSMQIDDIAGEFKQAMQQRSSQQQAEPQLGDDEDLLGQASIAAVTGDLSFIDKMVVQGRLDIFMKSVPKDLEVDPRQPFYAAIKHRNIKFIEKLFEVGAITNNFLITPTATLTNSPLYYAATLIGDTEIINLIADKLTPAQLLTCTTKGNPPICDFLPTKIIQFANLGIKTEGVLRKRLQTSLMTLVKADFKKGNCEFLNGVKKCVQTNFATFYDEIINLKDESGKTLNTLEVEFKKRTAKEKAKLEVEQKKIAEQQKYHAEIAKINAAISGQNPLQIAKTIEKLEEGKAHFLKAIEAKKQDYQTQNPLLKNAAQVIGVFEKINKLNADFNALSDSLTQRPFNKKTVTAACKSLASSFNIISRELAGSVNLLDDKENFLPPFHEELHSLQSALKTFEAKFSTAEISKEYQGIVTAEEKDLEQYITNHTALGAALNEITSTSSFQKFQSPFAKEQSRINEIATRITNLPNSISNITTSLEKLGQYRTSLNQISSQISGNKILPDAELERISQQTKITISGLEKLFKKINPLTQLIDSELQPSSPAIQQSPEDETKESAADVKAATPITKTPEPQSSPDSKALKFGTIFSNPKPISATAIKTPKKYPKNSDAELMRNLTLLLQDILSTAVLDVEASSLVRKIANTIDQAPLPEPLRKSLKPHLSDLKMPNNFDGQDAGHKNVDDLIALNPLDLDEKNKRFVYYSYFGFLLNDPDSICGKRVGAAHFSSLRGGRRLLAILKITDFLKENGLYNLINLGQFLCETDLVDKDELAKLELLDGFLSHQGKVATALQKYQALSESSEDEPAIKKPTPQRETPTPPSPIESAAAAASAPELQYDQSVAIDKLYQFIDLFFSERQSVVNKAIKAEFHNKTKNLGHNISLFFNALIPAENQTADHQRALTQTGFMIDGIKAENPEQNQKVFLEIATTLHPQSSLNSEADQCLKEIFPAITNILNNPLLQMAEEESSQTPSALLKSLSESTPLQILERTP